MDAYHLPLTTVSMSSVERCVVCTVLSPVSALLLSGVVGAAAGDIVRNSFTYSMFLRTLRLSGLSSNLVSVIFVFSPSDSKPGTAVGACMRIFLVSFDLAAGDHRYLGDQLFQTELKRFRRVLRTST